jgi:hypothetical protein
MEIKWGYAKSQLEAAVKFISANNEVFAGRDDYIREAMLDTAKRLVERFPDVHWMATMGYMVTLRIEEIESMDADENEAFIEFTVDAGLASKDWNDGDYFFETINVTKKT